MNAIPAGKLETAGIVGHFIDGKAIADDSRPAPVYNPATGKVTKQVAMASQKTVETAIAAVITSYSIHYTKLYDAPC